VVCQVGNEKRGGKGKVGLEETCGLKSAALEFFPVYSLLVTGYYFRAREVIFATFHAFSPIFCFGGDI
jgi:hypothetical protein